jgi:multicomponent Na+:H+ antiporter subunit B
VKSLILQTAARYLLPLLVLYSVFLLVRGHHEPGGGFIGGLMAAAPVALCALAYDVKHAQRLLPLPPVRLLALGLSLAVGSGVGPLLTGQPFLAAAWIKLPTPTGDLELGTPLLFDLGVYLVVIGVVTQIVTVLAADVPIVPAKEEP